MSTAAVNKNSTMVNTRLTVNEIMRKSRQAAARRRMIRKAQLITSILILISIFFIIIFNNIVKAEADQETDTTTKGYMYVTVEEDDTLWSIARMYSDEHYDSIYKYIREVKQLNGLTSDSIHAGARIIIPVYTEQNIEEAPYTVREDICQGRR